MLVPGEPAPAQTGLPGFTLPLDFTPKVMPHAWGVKVHREILMMRIMNTITDKPEWDRKVFDEEILSKWREEISQTGQDVSPAMMDYIIQELQWKAGLFKKDKSTTVFDMGVVKSDTAIPEELRRALVNEVFHLEDVLDEEKDYHPGSDEKVLDLVHPSLFPLVYGRTHILPNTTINLENCLGTVGQGELLPTPEKNEGRLRGVKRYSEKFQWLPCDVALNPAEPDSVRIVSYINNLHPTEHSGLYSVIEKVIARAIPLWNKTLTDESRLPARIRYHRVEYEEHPEPEPVQGEEENEDTYWDRYHEWESIQPIRQPEPPVFEASARDPEEYLDIQKLFGATGLQVIVKLANIELTPEKPEYDGGSWHIEGQLNERICATALYYYDSENIAESTLSFRQRISEGRISEVRYEQSRHEFLQQIYGLTDAAAYDHSQFTQDLGSVVCRQGRLLTFPNVFQHRVSPFSLKDRSQPGHRKILALFLVDPHLKIISTANIPPQQEAWGKEKVYLVEGLLSNRLPVELQYMVRNEGVLQELMSLEEAKKLRLELMEERSINSQKQNEEFEKGEFSLCEH
ncbi:uncharacterized protein N7483_003497 [Penicillium malachiteum]|uniref:uncharacterized protein n=1 Tax=Penicillium malachiteum TaxID=1324776 RepID=UPI0025465B28|nr:uncharacterized protein N7483_003497 [Penicillium malachiteum]KAJ5728989.1 hypothetical protein N7483_003497 [Penicillium malachiteum]